VRLSLGFSSTKQVDLLLDCEGRQYVLSATKFCGKGCCYAADGIGLLEYEAHATCFRPCTL